MCEREGEREKGILTMVKLERPDTSTLPTKEVDPEFFKVYIPNQSFKQMRIPPSFVKYLDDKLHKNYTLVSLVNSNTAWSVNLKEENDDLFFNKGWNNFVKENSLEFGDILIFTYLGAAQFRFKVFGQHCILKTDPFMNINNGKDPQSHKRKERQVKGGKKREYVEVIDLDDDSTERESETQLSKHGTRPQRIREFRPRKCKKIDHEAGY